jgi:hypothetical protein
LSPRLKVYNSTVPDKVNVLYTVEVNNPTAVEYCIKSLLYDYRYISNKEHYKCSLKTIVDIISKCENIVEGEYYCDKCRKKIIVINVGRKLMKFHDILLTNSILMKMISTCSKLLIESDNEYENEQIGGNSNYIQHDWQYKCLKYKIKYFELLLDKFSVL